MDSEENRKSKIQYKPGYGANGRKIEKSSQKGRGAKAAETAEKGLRKRGRVPEWLWIELREFYESQDYSQRDLAEYAASRGYPINQSRISQKAIEQGWVKGAIYKNLEEQALINIQNRMGEETAQMLDRHGKQSTLLINEGLHHIRVAQERRKTDPNHVIPVYMLRSLTSMLNEAQRMEARARGFNLHTGLPYAWETNDTVVQDAPEMVIRTLTAAEEAAIRRKDIQGDIDEDFYEEIDDSVTESLESDGLDGEIHGESAEELAKYGADYAVEP